MRSATLLVFLLLALTPLCEAQGPNRDDYIPVLVPVFFSGSGAQGSRWATSVELFSVGGFELPKAILEGNPSCPRPCGCSLQELVRDRAPVRVCGEINSASGIYLYVPKSVARGELQISARVRDLSRQAESAGTEIPVVRPSDLRAGSILLLDIPTSNRFRSSLRLYNVNRVGDENVDISIYDAEALRRGERTPLVQTQIVMPDPPVYVLPEPFPMQPSSFAMIGDLVTAYPQLAAVSAISIEVRGQHSEDAQDDPRRYWAFASITNNVTQEVTIVSPQ